MASSVYSTPKLPAVYWDCWLRNEGAPAWVLRLRAGDTYRGPAFTCYRLEEVIRFVQLHDRVYPVCLSEHVQTDIAEHFARRLVAAGLAVFVQFVAPFDQEGW